MNFFSGIFSFFSGFFGGGATGSTPAAFTAQAGAALAMIQGIAPLVEAQADVSPAIVAQINTALTEAQTIIAGLGQDPAPTDMSSALKALSTVVAAFPAGPNHDKAAAALSTLTLVLTVLHTA
jgi:hypothetical protein